MFFLIKHLSSFVWLSSLCSLCRVDWNLLEVWNEGFRVQQSWDILLVVCVAFIRVGEWNQILWIFYSLLMKSAPMRRQYSDRGPIRVETDQSWTRETREWGMLLKFNLKVFQSLHLGWSLGEILYSFFRILFNQFSVYSFYSKWGLILVCWKSSLSCQS